MIFLESVDSTHTYIKRYISENGYKEPLAIITQNQTNGIGSRDNKWEGKNGNLFFSFVIHQEELPIDLPLQSSSIYFSFFIKEILSDLGSKVFLKWPNDFYLNEKKIGGTITNFSNNLLYCGIGLNLKQFNSSYGGLDIEINLHNFLENYFNLIKKKMKWKKIFSKYRIEFESNRQYTTTINNKKVSLKDALLNEDGSINISNEKVFSLR
ncbi:biotin--[acetyl-CoA-carboxylase] ligase [Arcobacter sp. 15-2]|uniref:biotin--[acetyl-CoA-carboxylase] ligase n=1 Tax=Arcobacter sp. 15-2 TaxID=3374109 RepID=UPI00399D0606